MATPSDSPAVLAGERCHAGADHEVEVCDDTEVPHSELDEHRCAQRSVKPKRCRSAEWKSRSPKLISLAGSAAARHSTLSPMASRMMRAPSMTAAAARSSTTVSRRDLPPLTAC